MKFTDDDRRAYHAVDVANALLSHAADSGIDFMVVGGYGHSRMREFVLDSLHFPFGHRPNSNVALSITAHG
jgi:hypothetical protein